ncbi:MAG: hypothetical protein GF331_24570, partial [Chitinivibrionales bacterium]|nr:hypothetical protein [Chitinivibrionales bacterium]
MFHYTSWDEPDEEACGQPVGQEVYTARVLSRADILKVDSDRREKILVTIAFAAAIVLGCWLRVMRIA